MKNTSRLLYIIGLVLNIIGLVFSSLFLLVFAGSMNNAEVLQKVATDMGRPIEFVKEVMILGVIIFAVSVFVAVVVLVFSIIALRNLKKGNGKIGTHILLLILGILNVNPFYLFGGIFGIVAANQDANETDEE